MYTWGVKKIQQIWKRDYGKSWRRDAAIESWNIEIRVNPIWTVNTLQWDTCSKEQYNTQFSQSKPTELSIPVLLPATWRCLNLYPFVPSNRVRVSFRLHCCLSFWNKNADKTVIHIWKCSTVQHNNTCIYCGMLEFRYTLFCVWFLKTYSFVETFLLRGKYFYLLFC